MSFKWKIDEFADLQVLRYQVQGFDELNAPKKKLLYYLYRAALAGRDIMWDQNYKYNLYIRHVLETIYTNRPKGWKDDNEWVAFVEYLKRVWVSNGIHHHYSNAKFKPGFTPEFFIKQLDQVNIRPPPPGCCVEDIIFVPTVATTKNERDTSVDRVLHSAGNFYDGVSEQQVVDYYSQRADKSDQPAQIGMNTKLVGGMHGLVEMVWSTSGMYGPALTKVCDWLDKAANITESAAQATSLRQLIKFFNSGDPKDFDQYSIEWLKDTEYDIDVICGFIEDYHDPLCRKCSFETIVTVRDPQASARMETLCKEAQWFEDNSPVFDEHKKENATGINARVVNVVMESGDASPTTPIGVCLPNSDWLRKEHGSKSINMDNIINAYDAAAASSGSLGEFCYSEQEVARAKEHLDYGTKIFVDLHEVLGHGSGQTEPGVDPTSSLKGYYGVIEEARADLFALWYIIDPKLVEMGILESEEVAKSVYDCNVRNGMMCQLRRIKLGDDIQQTHMRQRQMIPGWLYEHTNSIQKLDRAGKTYYQVVDYSEMRQGVGKLLREIQRIKSAGDYTSAAHLIETFGVKVDHNLHQQVLERFEKIGTKPYSALVNPRLVMDDDQNVTIEYPDNFATQMLEYSREYSTLPDYNTRPLHIGIHTPWVMDPTCFVPPGIFAEIKAAGHELFAVCGEREPKDPLDYLITKDVTLEMPKGCKRVIFGQELTNWEDWYKVLY